MRKIFGIILIIIGWLLSLLACVSAIQSIIHGLKREAELINKCSYIFGTMIGVAIFGFIAYWLIKKGLQLTRKKKINELQEKMESIR